MMTSTSDPWFHPQMAITMKHIRKPNPDDLEAARQEIKEKLADLQKFIQQLARTPHGLADLQQRVCMLGECTQDPGEGDRDFYGKLRRWLERDCEEPRGIKSGSPLAWS